MEPNDPILLILDLDETLIYATEEPLGRGHDFVVGPYSVYRRPHLAEFLDSCSACFRLAIWSTASEEYVRAVVGRIMPPWVEPAFAWGRSRCVRSYDHELFEEEFLKDLKKVKRLGYDLRRVLAWSPYWLHGALTRKDDDWVVDPEMAAMTRGFLDRLLADRSVDLPVAFVLDAGVIRGVGPAVVEANEASGAGIYGCDPRDVLKFLRAATVNSVR